MYAKNSRKNLSNPDRFFLLFFAYNEIVSQVNCYLSVISSKSSATMNLATLWVAPIATRTVAASCVQGIRCLTSEVSWGSVWYSWGSFLISSSYSRHCLIQSNGHRAHCNCGHRHYPWIIVTLPHVPHIPASFLSEGTRCCRLRHNHHPLCWR